MRNSIHIVVPLGVSNTKQGLLQDRYSPWLRRRSGLFDHLGWLNAVQQKKPALGSGGWTYGEGLRPSVHKAEAPTA